MLNLLILTAGVAAIVWVNWYFFMAPKAAVVAKASDTGVQEVSVTVEGGYSPSVVRVRKGAPVRLTFDRREKSPSAKGLRPARPYSVNAVDPKPEVCS